MNNQVSFQGFGDVAVASQSEGSATKPTVWDQLNNAIKTAGNAAQVVSQVKTVISKPSSGSTSTASNPFATDASESASVTPAATTQDNTKKYIMIGGGVVVLGAVIFFATRKKKGKK